MHTPPKHYYNYYKLKIMFKVVTTPFALNGSEQILQLLDQCLYQCHDSTAANIVHSISLHP